MKKFFKLTVVLVFTISCLGSSAQKLLKPIPKKPLRCYTVERINELREIHPKAETDAQFESWMNQKIKERKQFAQRPATVNYTIPVVFHIIHNGEGVGTSPNVGAINIQEQMLQLNKDFGNLSNSQYASATATGIQFVLAEKDPTNNVLAEPGIDRIDRNAKSWNSYAASGWNPSYIDGTVKPNSTWNSNNYFNVWVIPNLTSGSTDILGYSTFPSSSTLAGLNNNETDNTAGIVILSSTVGSSFFPNNCNNEYGLGKTMAHEAGHFLGLRHIWGDSNCGTDFCTDTPIHTEANYGVPTHPKSNSCGTADEMFENYMDYCDDIVLNTFTSNQADRVQIVMLNSPRRLSLTTSSVGAVPVAGTNRISFANCSGVLSVMESGTTGTYPRYRDVNLTLNVDDKASGAATVNVTATGTAVNNFHYQLLTPSLTFAAGENYKNVRIRVFDNAEVDGDKTVIVNYSISGSGVRTALSAQSVTITIKDNDNVVVGNNPVAIYSENFGTTGGFFPSGWLTGSFLPTAPGPNVWNVGGNGGLDVIGQALYITNNNSTKPLSYSIDQESGTVAVTPKLNVTGYTNATLSFNYKCNGEEDTDGIWDFGSLMYSFDNANFTTLSNNVGVPYVYVKTPSITNSGNILLPNNVQDTEFSIGFRWYNDNNTGDDPPFLVDDIILTANPYQVETTISSSFAYDIRTGNTTNNFKSISNKVISVIKNASENITGLTAQITEAGTGTVPVTTAAGSYLRTQKVFKISPSVVNNTVAYQGTLYFTTAELAIWGADRLNLKILKVKDGVSLSSTLNQSNAELITPTVLENVAGGYITYTANFTGFSQFMLVSPLTSLPVSLISFQATALEKNIQLVWSTSQEINNRGFIIERSLDGTSFSQVGWVDGNGTTPLTTTYNFTDNFVQPNVTYFYRILQVDIDNRQVYSQVRNARLKPGSRISITVNPNPAKDYVNLFIKGTNNKATVELVNGIGQKLLQKNEINTANGIYRLSLPGLSKGVYIIVVYLPEGAYTKKIIVQ